MGIINWRERKRKGAKRRQKKIRQWAKSEEGQLVRKLNMEREALALEKKYKKAKHEHDRLMLLLADQGRQNPTTRTTVGPGNQTGAAPTQAAAAPPVRQQTMSISRQTMSLAVPQRQQHQHRPPTFQQQPPQRPRAFHQFQQQHTQRPFQQQAQQRPPAFHQQQQQHNQRPFQQDRKLPPTFRQASLSTTEQRQPPNDSGQGQRSARETQSRSWNHLGSRNDSHSYGGRNDSHSYGGRNTAAAAAAARLTPQPTGNVNRVSISMQSVGQSNSGGASMQSVQPRQRPKQSSLQIIQRGRELSLWRQQMRQQRQQSQTSAMRLSNRTLERSGGHSNLGQQDRQQRPPSIPNFQQNGEPFLPQYGRSSGQNGGRHLLSPAPPAQDSQHPHRNRTPDGNLVSGAGRLPPLDLQQQRNRPRRDQQQGGPVLDSQRDGRRRDQRTVGPPLDSQQRNGPRRDQQQGGPPDPQRIASRRNQRQPDSHRNTSRRDQRPVGGPPPVRYDQNAALNQQQQRADQTARRNGHGQQDPEDQDAPLMTTDAFHDVFG